MEYSHEAAQFGLADRLLKSGQKRKAFALFGILAKQGYTPVQTDAQFMRGKCYENGYGCKKSYPQAILWYEKAGRNARVDLSKNPNPVKDALAEAVFDAAEAHSEGFNAGIDEILFGKITPESIACKIKAAENGDSEAQIYLAELYNGGAGSIKDDQAQSAYWAERAAESGNAAAMNQIGERYYSGRGVEQDHAKALYWWEKAANQGIDASAYLLGKHYQAQRLYKTAAKWYRLYAAFRITRRNEQLGWGRDE